MTKQTRSIILLICLLLFFTITPWLIFYSLGYRVDLKNQCIIATGGIYVRAEQPGTEVIVDSRFGEKSSFFSNSVFMQNLTPEIHNILVKKEGYYSYQKDILVKEKEVAKIENITLFKNNINWEVLDKNQTNNIFPQENDIRFSLKSEDLYFSNASTNTKAPITQKAKIILKKVVSYKVSDNNIIWLSSDGNLNKSDFSGKNNEILTSTPILIDKKTSYKIFVNNFGIFILKNNDLLLLNPQTNSFDFFMANINDLKVSPDNQNIFYATNNEIWLNHSNYEYNLNKPQNTDKILLNKFYENISDIFWLNNNYLIIRAYDPSTGSGQVKISEIDNRGNINIVDLPLPAKNASGEKFSLDSKSQITFNLQDKKLYILTSDGLLLSSDKLLP